MNNRPAVDQNSEFKKVAKLSDTYRQKVNRWPDKLAKLVDTYKENLAKVKAGELTSVDLQSSLDKLIAAQREFEDDEAKLDELLALKATFKEFRLFRERARQIIKGKW
jgi:hypothetical protein